MASPVSDQVKVRGPSLLGLFGSLVGLLALAALSWGLAKAELGAWETPVALGIAAVKAALVAWVFMELSESGFVQRFIAVLTLLYITLLCTGIVTDVVLR